MKEKKQLTDEIVIDTDFLSVEQAKAMSPTIIAFVEFIGDTMNAFGKRKITYKTANGLFVSVAPFQLKAVRDAYGKTYKDLLNKPINMSVERVGNSQFEGLILTPTEQEVK